MRKKHIVTLTDEERQRLRALIASGKRAARKLMHARILLKADRRGGKPRWKDATIATGLEVGGSPPSNACASSSSRTGWRRHWCHAPRDGNTTTSWAVRRRRI